MWQLPRSAPKDSEKITITLSKATTAAANLRGELNWLRPEKKNGPARDTAPIAPAPL